MSSAEHLFSKHNCCVLIPTYNNEQTLPRVITAVQQYTNRILVVNDGSTDNTESVLKNFPGVHVIAFPRNRGKGLALRMGFKEAVKLGYENVITIDSDGQHYAEDIPSFLK